MSTLSRHTPPPQPHAHWGGVFAMTLCVFVLIASEFLPVSLLTPIAGELNITEGLAGQGIAISGALAVLTSLTISNLAGSLNRKHLLLGLTVLMAVSGMIVALAHSYAIYMAGRGPDWPRIRGRCCLQKWRRRRKERGRGTGGAW